jgi:large subunit ribosomal protein L15
MDGFDIRAPKGQKKNKRLGRGVGSGHGKTAGKGTKGQKARAGGGVRLGFEGGQMPLFRRIARRGFSNYPFKKEFQVVNVSDLNRFSDGETVNPETLNVKGLARKKGVAVKILGAGELTKKLIVTGAKVSASARDKILGMGGEVKEVPEAAKSALRKTTRETARKAVAEKKPRKPAQAVADDSKDTTEAK